MVYTRASRRTTVWLEWQPFGTPSRPCSEGRKGAKGGKTNSSCSSKIAKFARQRNATILAPNLPWFCLRDDGDWAELFLQKFGYWTRPVKEWRLREIQEAMDDSWYQMSRGEIPLAQFGMGGGQFENAESVLAAFRPGQDASMCADAKLLRDFAMESRDALRKKGHGASMQYYVPIPDPRVDPKQEQHKQYALGWSLVAMPCPVVDLSNKPDGGVTQVVPPFLNLQALPWDGVKRRRNSDREDPMNTVEPMLQAIGVLVWNSAESYYPDKVQGAVLKMIPHKTEVVKDDAGGDLWFNKSCASNRIATGIVHPDKPPGKRKQWYIYLGGG